MIDESYSTTIALLPLFFGFAALCVAIFARVQKKLHQLTSKDFRASNHLKVSIANDPIYLKLLAKLFSKRWEIMSRNKEYRVKQQHHVSTNFIHAGEEFSEGIRELTNYCMVKKPDFVIGINRGGVLIGSYIALSIGLQSKRFLRCCVTVGSEDEVECDFKDLHGVVIVIDSIARSGVTMRLATEKIIERYKNINKLYKAVVVATVDEIGTPTYPGLNFYYFATTERVIKLPWKQTLNQIGNHERSETIKEEYESIKDDDFRDIALKFYTENLDAPEKNGTQG